MVSTFGALHYAELRSRHWLPFDDNSFPRIGQSNYAGRVGEAETGSGGDQPDQGIAGRNSSADDEMERDPPGAFCYLGSEPTSGRRHGSAPGFGFDLETTSDQIDSAMPEKTHTEAPENGP